MDMETNTLRGFVTLGLFVAYIGIIWWAWSKRRAKDFSEAANLPFQQD